MPEFVGHLLTSKTVDEAARRVGISSRSSTRWLRTEQFRSIYVEQRQARLENIALLQQPGIGVTDAFAEVIRDPEAPATAQMNAAKTVLDTMQKITEIRLANSWSAAV
jgi:hypothetical protein